jgi:elongator complex protein 6
MILSLYSDRSLMDASQDTPLTKNQAILLTSLIHRSLVVVSLRPLQTGMAKDVNGIIRLTRGGASYDFGERSIQEDWEMLYRIDDGKAKLFKHIG